VGETLALVALYYSTARLGLWMALPPGLATPVWPASGIALAAVVLRGSRTWLGIWLGSFLANGHFLSGIGVPPATALWVAGTIGLGSTVQALCGTFLMHRWIGSGPLFERAQDVFRFVGIAAPSCLIAATLGVTSMCVSSLAPWGAYGENWVTWYLGDLVGILGVAPLFLTWPHRGPLRRDPQRLVEAGLGLGLLYIVAQASFSHMWRVQLDPYMLLPLLVWTVFRFGQRGIVVAILLVSTIAIGGTLNGFGPFVRATRNASLLALQAFLGIVAVTGLVLAAALTEHTRAAQALRKSEERYRTLVEESRDAIYMTSREGAVLEVNQAALDLFGYTRGEAIGLDARQTYAHPEDRSRFQQEIERQGAVRDYALKLRKKDGTMMDCLMSATVRRAPDGSILGYQGIIRDITAQQRLQQLLEDYSRTLERRVDERTQELQAKNARLEDTLRQLQTAQTQLLVQQKLASLGALTAGIAHEMRNPLNFVTNFADLSVELVQELRDILARHQPLFATDTCADLEDILYALDQNVQKIIEHGKRADRIVSGMLQHAQGQAGGYEPTDLNALLAEYVNLAYHGMRAQDAVFNISIDTHYDPSIGLAEVIPQDIGRVFLNVLNNACYAVQTKHKALGEGFRPTLCVRTANLGDRVEIRIRDNGDGMPPQVREQIFQPFFTTKPAGAGTGLGLSISHDIVVQEHKGTISVDTEVGKYAEFIITLPKQAT
jgi:PAS domain S-box-containing protein